MGPVFCPAFVIHPHRRPFERYQYKSRNTKTIAWTLDKLRIGGTRVEYRQVVHENTFFVDEFHSYPSIVLGCRPRSGWGSVILQPFRVKMNLFFWGEAVRVDTEGIRHSRWRLWVVSPRFRKYGRQSEGARRSSSHSQSILGGVSEGQGMKLSSISYRCIRKSAHTKSQKDARWGVCPPFS